MYQLKIVVHRTTGIFLVSVGYWHELLELRISIGCLWKTRKDSLMTTVYNARLSRLSAFICRFDPVPSSSYSFCK